MAASDWPERTRMWVTVGVAVGVNILLGVGLFMVRGQWNDMDQSRNRKKKERTALQQEVDKEPELKAQWQSLQDKIAEMKRKLPKQENLPELVTKIADLSQQTGCTQKASIYQPGGPVAGAAGLSVSQETWRTRWEADFMKFGKLANQLEEHFDRFIALENLIISPRNQGMVEMGTPEAQEEFSVDLVTYRYTGP
jgi:Tfp pilus assembly protein PilO